MHQNKKLKSVVTYSLPKNEQTQFKGRKLEFQDDSFAVQIRTDIGWDQRIVTS